MYQDLVYANWNRVAARVYWLSLLGTGAAAFLDWNYHPVSFVTNGVTLLFGFLLWWIIDGNEDERAKIIAEVTAKQEKAAARRAANENDNNNQEEAQL